ncbi:MAG: PAS domain-containing protein [Candidatus Woesearchaeota archaeon]
MAGNAEIPESNLERLARTITPEQVKVLVGTFYQSHEPALLLDPDYRFMMANRAAELRIGYTSDQIHIDSLRLQPEVFRRLREICQDQFDNQGKKFFELKGIAYGSSNKATSFLFNIKVSRMRDGGAVVYLQKVAKQPYKQQEGDLVVAAPAFIDDHWNRKDLWRGETFEEKLNAAYLCAQQRRVVIDLSRTKDVGYLQAREMAKKIREMHKIILLDPKPEVYEQLHLNGEGVPADRFYYSINTSLAPAPKPV